MFPEALLHPSELVHTVNTFHFFFRVHKAAERSLELFATRSMSHSTQAGAIPIDFASLRIVRS